MIWSDASSNKIIKIDLKGRLLKFSVPEEPWQSQGVSQDSVVRWLRTPGWPVLLLSGPARCEGRSAPCFLLYASLGISPDYGFLVIVGQHHLYF